MRKVVSKERSKPGFHNRLQVALDKRVWRLHLYFRLRLLHPTYGVNSDLGDGLHMLMWDFDERPLQDVTAALWTMQEEFFLPSIYIVRSSAGECYHAYCFKRVRWNMAKQIAASTPWVDDKWLGIGILRGFFTLRFKDGHSSTIDHVATLVSTENEDVDPYAIVSFSDYYRTRG